MEFLISLFDIFYLFLNSFTNETLTYITLCIFCFSIIHFFYYLVHSF